MHLDSELQSSYIVCGDAISIVIANHTVLQSDKDSTETSEIPAKTGQPTSSFSHFSTTQPKQSQAQVHAFFS